MKPRNYQLAPGQANLSQTGPAKSTGVHRVRDKHLSAAVAGLGWLFVSSSSYGQEISLGVAENFTIISSQGVTSSGPTIIHGNIALSPLTTITGFNGHGTGGPGTVTGEVRFNDQMAQNAQIDARTAYNTLAGIAQTNDLTGMDLGGLTLTPGVYNFDSSAGLTGELTLDSLGSSDSVFIFQIGSTLTTSVGSQVIAVGPNANVYWQVGSSATINSDSLFNGNILALSSISFGTGADLVNGRAIALNGAVTLLSNDISPPLPDPTDPEPDPEPTDPGTTDPGTTDPGNPSDPDASEGDPDASEGDPEASEGDPDETAGRGVGAVGGRNSFRRVPELTPNERAVAELLDNTSGPLVDFLRTGSNSSLPGVFNLIAPDELTAVFQMGFAAGETQNTNLKRHLEKSRRTVTPIEAPYTPMVEDSKSGLGRASAKDGRSSKGGLVIAAPHAPYTEPSRGWSIFLEGTHGSAEVDGSRDANGYDFDSEGVTLGADLQVSDRLIVGVLGTYTTSDASLFNGGNIDVTSYRGAVYATFFQNDFYLDALVGAGKNSYDTRRLSLGSFAEGSTDGLELNSMLNAGYNIHKGNWTLTPTASLGFTRIELDSFTETGSLTPLHFPEQHQESLRSELGVNLAYTVAFNSVTVTPQLRLAWQHEYLDSTQTMDSRFANGSGPLFSVNGPHMKRDRAMIGAGVNVQITPTLSVYGYYDGQLGSSDYRSNNFTAGLRLDF